ncbi:FAD synthase [Babesia caballi]|uniref:FAD synthase n=1 Tax=Babesia caballi TaxID=5871 RepID=A0AAV4LWG4_BABCB|nr:FAD synthase [Babesia caballi]
MSKDWKRLEAFARILSAPLQRHVIGEAESSRLAALIDRASCLLSRSYRLASAIYSVFTAGCSELGYENVYVSFNGGKDSVAVLHLHRLATLADPNAFDGAAILPFAGMKYYSTYKLLGKPLNVVFFKDPNERLFPEISDFIQLASKTYNFTLRVIEDTWHRGIPQLPSSGKKGFVLGCRSTDFEGIQLAELEEGSAGGVEFTRIHPILNWNYGDVWNFLRLYSLEYCPIYDAGYTSIGGTEDTIANACLRNPDGTYAPAYTLKDWSKERCGRIKPKRKADTDG